MRKYVTCVAMLAAPFLSAQTTPDSVEPLDSLPTQSLSEVVVEAHRPEAIVMPDKVSYSPSVTVSGSSGTIYDALCSLPGVNVDNGGSISVNGQKGVMVSIDGRKSVLSGEALMLYLKSLPASGVDRIEILSPPTAKNDASSATTTINLKMRKNRDAGFNLGLNGSGRLWKAKRGLGTISAGYNTGKSALTLTYIFIAARNPSKLFTNRQYGNGNEWLTQTYNRKRRDRIHNASAGFEHRFSDRWSTGLSLTGNWFSRYELGEMYTSVPYTDYDVYTRNNTDMHYRNIFGNAWLKRIFNDGNGDLSLGIDYFNYRSDEIQRMSDNLGTSVDGDMGGMIKGYVGTFDFKRRLGRKWSLSAGVKSTYLLIDNGGKYDDDATTTVPVEDNLSSTFDYRENVNAAYTECKLELLPLLVTAGIRCEQTNVKSKFSGNEAIEQADYRRHYIDFFQNVSASMQLGERDGMMLSYARRITRPRYADLNPFVYIFDDITHVGGNISLKPSITNAFQIAYSHDSWFRVMLGASVVDDYIVKCYREISDKLLYVSPENLPRKIQTSLTVSAINLKVSPWWHISLNATVIYDNYKFGGKLNIPGNCRFSPMLDCKNMLSFPGGWIGELSGQWRCRMAYGQATVCASGSVYMGLKKTIMRGQGSVSVYVRDLFNTNHQRTSIRLTSKTGSLSEYEYESMRQIGVSVGFRFKTGNVHTGKKRTDDLIDEIKRVNL